MGILPSGGNQLTVRIKDLGSYLSAVNQLRKQWKVPGNDELWFRAEDASHFNTRLMPGLYRPRKGRITRDRVQDLLELERELYEEFGRCGPQLSPADSVAIDDEWDSYFLMQHHGAPTRLLDWSDGALIALHFAVKDKPSVSRTDSAIYVLEPYWLIDYLEETRDQIDAVARWKKYWQEKRPFDTEEEDWDRLYLPLGEDNPKEPRLHMPKTPLLWDSPHVTRRIAAQRSRFMIFGSDPFFLRKLERDRDSRLVSIIVPRSRVNRIRQELRDAGITESVVYPDLDGLGRELKQRWKMES
jgi:hypothetical protein